MMLNDDEIERYARHIVLPEIGGPGQQRLKNARVLVVGAGGLGAPLIQYLAAAGVGKIGIVDDDIVSLSNLQRQTIFSTADLGKHKAVAAAGFARRLNPHVAVEEHVVRLDAHNARALIAFFDRPAPNLSSAGRPPHKGLPDAAVVGSRAGEARPSVAPAGSFP